MPKIPVDILEINDLVEEIMKRLKRYEDEKIKKFSNKYFKKVKISKEEGEDTDEY